MKLMRSRWFWATVAGIVIPGGLVAVAIAYSAPLILQKLRKLVGR